MCKWLKLLLQKLKYIFIYSMSRVTDTMTSTWYLNYTVRNLDPWHKRSTCQWCTEFLARRVYYDNLAWSPEQCWQCPFILSRTPAQEPINFVCGRSDCLQNATSQLLRTSAAPLFWGQALQALLSWVPKTAFGYKWWNYRATHKPANNSWKLGNYWFPVWSNILVTENHIRQCFLLAGSKYLQTVISYSSKNTYSWSC